MTNANNYLTLRKCAYIFDASNATYFWGTPEQYEQKTRVNKELKTYYYNPEKCNNQLCYSEDENGNISIEICGEKHYLNALQIASISDVDNVINHRRDINRDKILSICPHFKPFCSEDLLSKKYRTLRFEFFTGADDLGYIRVYFNGWNERFIIDDRTGELYTSGESGTHKPITAGKICERLNIKSSAARSEFYEVINAITK